MQNTDLGNLLIGNQARIAQAISCGAGWEIWIQIELALWLRANNVQVAREVSYPPPNANLTLDLLAQDNLGRYAIELKVESATNAGHALFANVRNDLTKIANYGAPQLQARWVVAIAYSGVAKGDLLQFANANPGVTIYQDVPQSIGVLIVTV